MTLKEGVLHWPVTFVYPEHQTTDFIESFSEELTLGTMLSQMFTETPPWDRDGKYAPERMSVWVENRQKESIHRVDINAPLNSVLRHQEMFVFGGCPSIIITVHQSPFESHFLKRYNRQ